MSLHFLIKRWRPQGWPSDSIFLGLCLMYLFLKSFAPSPCKLQLIEDSVKEFLTLTNHHWCWWIWWFWWWAAYFIQNIITTYHYLSHDLFQLIMSSSWVMSPSSWPPQTERGYESESETFKWKVFCVAILHLGPFSVVNPINDVMKYIPRPDSLWPLQFLFWTHVRLTLRPLASQIR